MRKIRGKWSVFCDEKSFHRAIAFMQMCGYELSDNIRNDNKMGEWDLLSWNNYFTGKGIEVVSRSRKSLLTLPHELPEGPFLVFKDIDQFIKYHLEIGNETT